ncbi:hypothetical protein LINPERPRIM_LOCUS29508 [Linum perenne]
MLLEGELLGTGICTAKATE